MDSKDVHRLVALSLSMFLLFCFIIIRFYQLQIFEGEKWSSLAKQQHHFKVTEPFKRGRFFASSDLKRDHPAHQHVLVCDVKRYHLYADPLSVPETGRDEMIKYLSQALLMTREEIAATSKQLSKRSHSRKLKMWLTEAEKIKIETWWRLYSNREKISLNALYFIQDYRRFYPYGGLLGHVLHTVRDERDPSTQQCVPTGGLEMTLDPYLRGKPGKRLQLRSPHQSLESNLMVARPEDGADVYLTIEPYIQAIVEEEIARGVRRVNARSGWAIMVDPNSGEIIALAQYPEFEPARYRDYYNDPALIEMTKVRGATDCFEPGSTMKPLSMAVALLANKELKKRNRVALFSPTEMIPVRNGMFPGRTDPVKDVGYHRFLNMYLAIQKSSNIYAAKLAERIVNTLGERWYRQQLQDVFGFGKKTGIELPGESVGFLPSVDGKYRSGRPPWSVPTPYSLSFGYNLLATSLQMVRAYCIIANGGWDVKLTLIKKIMKEQEVLFQHAPSLEKKRRVLDEEISRELIFALKSVTKPGGAGWRADIPGYTEAGKTGTTEKIVDGAYSRRHHYASFVGFAPTPYPRFALYVAIDEPEYRDLPGVGRTYFGGQSASPVFSKIMSRTFEYLAIPPDDPHGYPKEDPRFDSKKADWMEQVKILKELYEKWNPR